MGINNDSDRVASLVIGPTSLGMVRIYIESDGIELPMDFEPDEALDIANELRAAAEMAMATAAKGVTAKGVTAKGAANSSEADRASRRDANGGPKSGRKRGDGGRHG